MLTIYTDRHRLHAPKGELVGGTLAAPFEKPERAEIILRRIETVGLGPVTAPTDHGLAPILRIHDPAYVEFLQSGWSAWQAAGLPGDMIPNSWRGRNLNSPHTSTSIEAKLGHYALTGETAITATTWDAAYWSAQVALSAQDALQRGEKAAFALCRPPGHHAPADQFGGYCFLNNAAIAAQAALDRGAQRVAILDIDFHHGNGTQQIFYSRNDVLMLSIHGTPKEAYPYFLGWEDETGEGAGRGYTVNYPLPPASGYDRWSLALDHALAHVQDYGADLLVISLGVDTFEHDPISFFKLASPDYLDCGARIGRLGLPTLFVMEGGYAVAEIGVNAVNVLQGFETAR